MWKTKILIAAGAILILAVAGLFALKPFENRKHNPTVDTDRPADTVQPTVSDTTADEQKEEWLSWDDIEWIGPRFDDEEVYDALEWYYVSEELDERPFIGILKGFVDFTAAPKFFNMMPYTANAKTSEVTEPDSRESFINNFLCYVGRNNDLILRFYKKLRPVIEKIIFETDYFDRLGAKHYIQALDQTRNIFLDDTGKGWNTELLGAMYEYLDTEAEGDDPGQIVQFFAGYDLEIFDFSCRDDEDEIPVYWAYSFWARRYHEGNIRAVDFILDDLLYYVYENFDPSGKYYADAFTDEHLPLDAEGNSVYNYEYKRWEGRIKSRYSYSYKYDSLHRRTGEWRQKAEHYDDYYDDRSSNTIIWHMSEGKAEGKYKWYSGDRLMKTLEYHDGKIVR